MLYNLNEQKTYYELPVYAQTGYFSFYLFVYLLLSIHLFYLVKIPATISKTTVKRKKKEEKEDTIG